MISISGTDNGGQYEGIEFNNEQYSTDQLKDPYHYSLKILEKRNGNWYVPEESKIKFLTTKSGNRRDISIDDGELTP